MHARLYPMVPSDLHLAVQLTLEKWLGAGDFGSWKLNGWLEWGMGIWVGLMDVLRAAWFGDRDFGDIVGRGCGFGKFSYEKKRCYGIGIRPLIVVATGVGGGCGLIGSGVSYLGVHGLVSPSPQFQQMSTSHDPNAMHMPTSKIQLNLLSRKHPDA
ncbi:hypothetical protein VNO78_08361 [Psophocarpus tetragonolobus]|uniref:Uncharacterized protein n=1 Tax=Psophocarpus tetragonolobus TaxID=3891 RepID=A0AAN9XTP2_PSOTE